MFKNRLVFEVKGQNERVYRLECPHDAPLGELHDALVIMKNYVVDNIHRNAEAEKGKEDPKEKADEQEKPKEKGE